MLSKEDYEIFQANVEYIIRDTFVAKDPSPEDFKQGMMQGRYSAHKGLWHGTENRLYIYHKEKIAAHKNRLLALCKKLPKYHAPCAEHGGTVSCFDLIVNYRKYPSMTREDVFYQLAVSNHFANLLEDAKIATVHPFALSKDNQAYFLVIDSQYRSLMEPDGQEWVSDQPAP